MAARVNATWLNNVSLTRRYNNITKAYANATSIRFRRAHTSSSAMVRSNANANANNEAEVIIADRLHNQATPWLMLPSEVDEMSGDKVECFYSPADGQTVRLNRKNSLKVPDTAECVASTKGSWLGYVDTKEGSFYLSNPFLNQVVELPSLEHLPSVVGVERDPETGSILKFKVSYPDYEWYTWDGNPDELDPYDIDDPEFMINKISHLALSMDNPHHPNCVAMAMQGEMSRLAYCRSSIGGNNNNYPPAYYHHPATSIWHGLQEDYFPGLSINQLVYCSKKHLFYALFLDTGILAFDVERDRGRRTKKVSQFRMFDLDRQLEDHFFFKEGDSESLKEIRRRCDKSYYLVTLYNGDLLLLVRHFTELAYKTIHFDVFRVAYPGTLERVRSLEDRAIFIGHNQSFCIKASASPGIRPNSIYFTINPKDWGNDSGIFSLENGVISPIGHPNNNHNEEDEPLYSWVAPVTYTLLEALDNQCTLPHDVYCVEG